MTVEMIGAIATVASVIGGGIGSAVVWWFSRGERRQAERKLSAEVDGVTVKNMTDMLKLVQDLREQLKAVFDANFELEAKVASLERTVEALKEGRVRDRQVINTALEHIEELRRVLKENGHHPPEMPGVLAEWLDKFKKGKNGE